MSQKGEGYVMMDHRAGPGIPGHMARAIGLPEKALGDGTLFEAAILRCKHCPTPYLKNPYRTRERNRCAKCNDYICDTCAMVAAEPGYVHVTFSEIIDKVKSGRFTVSGTSSRPILIPVTI